MIHVILETSYRSRLFESDAKVQADCISDNK